LASGGRNKYTDEEVERGLQVLALHVGNSRRAAKALEQQGHRIPDRTLDEWRRNTHPERYSEICAERAPQVADRIAAQMEQYVTEAGEVQRHSLHMLKDRLDKEELQEAATLGKINQSLGIPIGIATQRSSELRGRPTVIHEHRSAEQLLEGMKRRGWIDGEAHEVRDELPPARTCDAAAVARSHATKRA